MSNWGDSKIGVYSLADIADGAIRTPPPLFSGLLLDNTLTMIAAPPYVGKSMLLGAMAVSLDSGLPLFGKYAPADDKRVLMIAQDAPNYDYAGQLNKLMRGFGLDVGQRALLDTRLIMNRGIQVTDKDFFTELEKQKKDTDFNVLILDAFWTIHGLNENDQSQMGIVMARLKKIREDFGCAVIFAHHNRKKFAGEVPDNANYSSRGSSAIPDSIDFNISLSRSGTRVKVQLAKCRGSDDEGLLFYDLIDVDHPEGPALELRAVNLGTTRLGQVLEFVATERVRKDIVAHMTVLYPEMTYAKACKAVDNDLRLLRAIRKVESVRHGVWKACME